MKATRAVSVTLMLTLGGCAATSTTAAAKPESSSPGPASWQGAVADQMNRRANGPATPALKGLQGQAPLVYVARVPPRGALDEPAYEVAVFDDGTLVYEGHRCVKVGGVVLTHVRPDEMTRLGGALAALCTGLDDPNTDELCEDPATLRVLCSNGERLRASSDHCRKTHLAQAEHVDALVSALIERFKLEEWLGEPTQRQACDLGARDLSPHELARTVRSDLAEAARLGR